MQYANRELRRVGRKRIGAGRRVRGPRHNKHNDAAQALARIRRQRKHKP